MDKKPSLQIRNLTKRIGSKTIVNDLTLAVSGGEVLGLLGPQGGGRTTAIGMITGMVSITSGQVLINGYDLKQDFEQAMNEIGAVVKHPDLYKFLTGYHNLLHFARMSPQVAEERIEEVAALVGLEAHIQDKVKTYSAGMQQRLALAQAILHKPSVLIFEPIGPQLDDLSDLRNILRKLAAEEDMAIVISSHLMSQIEVTCDRVAILNNGILVSVREIHEPQKQDTDRDGGEQIG